MSKVFNEIVVSIESDILLKGTLSLPQISEPSYPAVLLIPGSGLSDRNGNSFAQRSNILKHLSDAICRLGYATLRYDKRGVGESDGNYYEVGLYERIDDAQSAVQYLINHNQIDSKRIFVLGHSEGSIIASSLSQRLSLQGLILLTAPFDLIEQTFLMQAKNMEKSMTNKSSNLFSRLIINVFKFDVVKAQKRLFEKVKKTNKAVIRVAGKKINAKWMREAFEWDGRQVYSSITCPTLVISGEKDLQVLGDDGKKIAACIQGPVECYTIKDLTHILRKDFDEPSFMHYQKLMNKPLDHEVITIIEKWLREYLPKTFSPHN